MKIRQAVILAGGLGTRLRPLTDNLPKLMIPFHNKPFIEYLIEMLKENGIEEVVLLLGYLPEKVTEYFGDGSKFGIKIRYSINPVEWDTGTRVKKAEKMLDENFLLMYCDNYWPLNLNKLVEFHGQRDALMTVTIFTNKDKSTKSNMRVDEQGYVTLYDKTRQEPNLSGVDIGFFITSKKVVEKYMPEDADFSLQSTLVKLVEAHKLAGFLTDHKYYSVGSIERLPVTEKFLAKRKVIFLDRDGVINKKAPKADYVKKWEEFEFLPGVIEGLELLSKKGYELYILTNQPGIARGMMTLEDLNDIHARMLKEFEKHNIKITQIYACLHGWNDGCECRKPKPGLFFDAAREHAINLTKAVFIGDDERDVTAGEAADIKTILVSPEKGLAEAIESFVSSKWRKICKI